MPALRMAPQRVADRRLADLAGRLVDPGSTDESPSTTRSAGVMTHRPAPLGARGDACRHPPTASRSPFEN
ncbi:hypothetical protein WS83_00375 [Burkholderia sp. MSMB2042]|nr:hypothetical protein WS77_22930 [Burkholderia sp. MSMB0265]KVG94164.1 hypothetical protein WS83_00375 [Burkholderia sp. MSMB2042]